MIIPENSPRAKIWVNHTLKKQMRYSEVSIASTHKRYIGGEVQEKSGDYTTR